MTILKRYKCIKSNDEKRFAVGEIYPLYKGDRNYIVANNSVKWYENDFSCIEESWGVELEEMNENEMLNVKEGQTYICKRSDIDWWTKDKEYKVQKFSDDSRLYLTDDSNYHWYLNNNLLNQVFKLKEKTFDLNKLTTAQLKEYVGLLEDKEKTEALLNDFIERMSK